MIDVRQPEYVRLRGLVGPRQALDRGVELEQQAAVAILAHQALDPGEGCQALAARYRRHVMDAGARIEDGIARRQLDRARAEQILDDEFAAIVAVGIAQHQGERQIGADPLAGPLDRADRTVEMRAVVPAAGITVEQRRQDRLRQCRRQEHRIALQPVGDEAAEPHRHRILPMELAVLLDRRGQMPRRRAPIGPSGGAERPAALGHLFGAQNLRYVQQHRAGD